MSITLSNSRLEAQISPLGAELVRFRDEEGRDLLWDGDPAFWSGRSPLLFPIVGRLKDDRIRIHGREHSLTQHGFARTSEFEVRETGPSNCQLRLSSSPLTLEHYPFEFRLDVSYRLEDSRLIVSATILNSGESPMPVSFGFHPAFRWPLPYGGARAGHEIRFEQMEPEPMRLLVDNLLGAAHESPIEGDRLTLRDELFGNGALIFDRIRSRNVEYGVPGQRSIKVGFAGMPHLGIWTKPGARFICIEPWQGHASPVGFDGELGEKPGVVLVSPGDTREFAMEISLSDPWVSASA